MKPSYGNGQQDLTTPSTAPTQTSLAAFQAINYDRVRKNKLYQQIIAVLSDGKPRTREQLEAETRMKGNTLRPRVRELEQEGILTSYGTGYTQSGKRAELLTLYGV